MKFNFKWKTLAMEYIGIVAIVTFITMHVIGDSFRSALLNSMVSALFVSIPMFAIITGYRFIKHQNAINNFLLKRYETKEHDKKANEIVLN